MLPASSERGRIRRVYEGYASNAAMIRRWRGPGHRLLIDDKWREMEKAIRRAGHPGPHARVLDLGSANGHDVIRFASLGFAAARIVCVDLRIDPLAAGLRGNTGATFAAADATDLPFADSTFDVVHQSVMVSSVLSRSTRRRIATEMVRVTRPGGIILWYDLRYPNPFNRNVRRIGRRDLRTWFAGLDGRMTTVTLLPPLARALAPLSTRACALLARLPPLRSHLLAVLRKP